MPTLCILIARIFWPSHYLSVHFSDQMVIIFNIIEYNLVKKINNLYQFIAVRAIVRWPCNSDFFRFQRLLFYTRAIRRSCKNDFCCLRLFWIFRTWIIYLLNLNYTLDTHRSWGIFRISTYFYTNLYPNPIVLINPIGSFVLCLIQ